jgi:hypothetical protein
MPTDYMLTMIKRKASMVISTLMTQEKRASEEGKLKSYEILIGQHLVGGVYLYREMGTNEQMDG